LVGQCFPATYKRLAFANFLENPLNFWKSVLKYKQVCDEGRPAQMHVALAKISNGFSKMGRGCAVITTEFDGYQRQIMSSDSSLLEISGNVHYMRCSKLCTRELYKTPTCLGQAIPTCT
jgi:NAD-dependent SIR2 family protein deacetylase